jgi:kynureninase
MHDPASAKYAAQMDRADPLRSFRDRFVVDDPAVIYLDGNSLGRLPVATPGVVDNLLAHQWGARLIRSWNDGWIDAPFRIGDKIAGIIGARMGEVVVADSTSINLYKLALAAMRARPDRHKIVTDDLNFPSDLYILHGICELLGPDYQIEIVCSPDGIHGPVAEFDQAVDEDTALVTLSHTVFKSAYTYDMAAVTERAHDAGALVLWDLSHAAGAMPVDLSGTNADLAVGCCYKYLNGGPGAPAFLYVRRDLQSALGNPLQGWMGQADMFGFDLEYEAAAGLRRFLTGTPPILSVAAIEPGIDLLLEAGIDRIRVKSVAQTDYLIALWEQELASLGFVLNTPQEPDQRGSHVSLGHPDGWRIDQALINEMQVLPDFRTPDNIRLGITPLYTTYAEIRDAVMRIKTVVEAGIYERYDRAPAGVT